MDLERIFKLKSRNTDVRTEVSAGITTFLTMAYIIVVQPMILSGRMFGFESDVMDFGAVMTATCLSSAIATLVMALAANYPIALAPGMGENFVFVLTAVPAAAAAGSTENPWQAALGVVFISGVLFLLLSLTGIREKIINSVSSSMKHAMAAGIGLFIAFIGLQNAGLVIRKPGTMVALNAHFASPDLVIFFIGLLLTSSLYVHRVRGAILWGICATTAAALILRGIAVNFQAFANIPAVASSKLMTQFTPAGSIASLPPSIEPVLFKMDIAAALSVKLIPFIVIFLFMDVFDTIGTLIGVAEHAGLIKDNRLPDADRALMADAFGTVAGACMGTSTVTSFIESAAGAERGGRTGLTALTVAVLFLLALFFSPLVNMLGSYASLTAPALVIVGSLMMRNAARIDFDDFSESVPAFLTLIGIPLTYSIADGLALGFISYPIVKLLGGKGRSIGWLMYLLAAILILYMILVRRVIN